VTSCSLGLTFLFIRPLTHFFTYLDADAKYNIVKNKKKPTTKVKTGYVKKWVKGLLNKIKHNFPS
jgi:hypothetical protein